jgi:hypothetical protein
VGTRPGLVGEGGRVKALLVRTNGEQIYFNVPIFAGVLPPQEFRLPSLPSKALDPDQYAADLQRRWEELDDDMKELYGGPLALPPEFIVHRFERGEWDGETPIVYREVTE